MDLSLPQIDRFNIYLNKCGVKDLNYHDFITSFFDNREKIAYNLSDIYVNSHFLHQIEDADSIESLEDTLKEMFSPNLNGFELMKISSNIPSDREIWTDSVCYLVKEFTPIYTLLF